MVKRKSRTFQADGGAQEGAEAGHRLHLPFCHHLGAVRCRIFLKGRRPYAVASCSVGNCRETYATVAHALTEPIDVYSEWIDACEEANEGGVVRRPRLGHARD